MEPQNWYYNNTEGVINIPFSNNLMNFFDRYKVKSKQSIFDKLQRNDIDYDELIQFEEEDFRCTFNSLLQPLELSRLFNALKNNPQSAIFKEKERKKIVHVVISEQEQNAINFIETSMNTNKTQLENTSNIKMNKLSETLSQNTAIIDSLFDEIIDTAINQKNQLMQRLNTSINDRENMIESQMTQLKERQKRLNECYQQSQDLIADYSLDTNQRKNRILCLYVDVLDELSDSSAVETNVDICMNVHKLQNDIGLIKNILMKLNGNGYIGGNDIGNDMDSKDESVEEIVETVLSEVIKERSEVRTNSESVSVQKESVQKAMIQEIKDKDKKEKVLSDDKEENEWMTVKSTKKRKLKRKKKKEKEKEKVKVENKNNAYCVAVNTEDSMVKGKGKVSVVVKNTQYEETKQPMKDAWYEGNDVYQDVNVNSASYKTIECKFYKRFNNCYRGRECRYAHGLKELKKYNPFARTKPCPFIAMGRHCPNGDVCNYKHPNDRK